MKHHHFFVMVIFILLCRTFLTGMSYQSYLNTGGNPLEDPNYTPETVYDPTLARIYPYLALTGILGVFLLTNIRKLMIVDWQLPFPSGTASGIMMESFHTTVSDQLLLWTATHDDITTRPPAHGEWYPLIGHCMGSNVWEWLKF